MKPFILFISSFIITINVFGQSKTLQFNHHEIEISDKLIEHFGKETIDKKIAQSPDQVLYLNYFVENAYAIVDAGFKSNEASVKQFNIAKNKKSKAPTFDPSNPSSFNALSYGIKLSEKQQVYKTGFKNDVIIIKPKKEFFNAFNKYKAELQK